MKSTISVLIINYNGLDVLPRCLDALSQQTFENFEIIIVDNGGKDGSADSLGNQHANLKVIRLNHNTGFSAANNLGAYKAEGQWLALINNDAFPEPDWLERFIAAQKKYPHASAFGSLILQDAQPNLVDSAGDIYNISGIAWKGYGGYPATEVPSNPRRIFAPCAAAAFYRRDVFLEIGGFDEDFFSYFEDVDLGFRLNLYGYQCIFLPDARVRHVGSVSAGKNSDFALYHYHRNFIWSYIKNMPGALFWLYLPFHILANFIFFLKYIIKGRGKVIFKAKIDALKVLRKMWRKRRNILCEQRASISEINILLDKNLMVPYLQGRKLRQYNREHGVDS